jgi:hypothetical protein
MEKQEQPKRIVTIYFPNNRQEIYTTSKTIKDSNYIECEKIVCDHGNVSVVYMEDGKPVGKTFNGMPYELEMYED